MDLREHPVWENVKGVRQWVPSVLQEFRWNSHTWGREAFANNYAKGGISSVFFAESPGGAWRASWRRHLGGTIEEGSAAHIYNLRRLQKMYPANENIAKSIANAEEKMMMKANMKALYPVRSALSNVGSKLTGKVGGAVANVAFIAYAAYSAPGDMGDKTRAAAVEAAGTAGFWAGSMIGSSAGAAIGQTWGPIGSAVGYGVGFLVGGLAGYFVATAGAETGISSLDEKVRYIRNRRNLDWQRNTAAFNTERAYTMRQQSLAMMNRGMNSARSILGREGVLLHS